VLVEIRSLACDPKRAHLMYNDVTDGLECAAECGFDAVCVNEHHSNGYGLMRSPNLNASSLARRTMDTALCAMGNSLALFDPRTRVAGEFAKGPRHRGPRPGSEPHLGQSSIASLAFNLLRDGPRDWLDARLRPAGVNVGSGVQFNRSRHSGFGQTRIGGI
jgi:hypothetical protein